MQFGLKIPVGPRKLLGGGTDPPQEGAMLGVVPPPLKFSKRGVATGLQTCMHGTVHRGQAHCFRVDSPAAGGDKSGGGAAVRQQFCDHSLLLCGRVLQSIGPTNTRRYHVAVYFRGERLATGIGHSIQQAEMNTAANALTQKAGRSLSTTCTSQAALLPQRDRATRCVSHSLVNCRNKLYNKSTTSRSSGVRGLWLIAVERGLVVGFCGQPHYCYQPYYPTCVSIVIHGL